MLEFKDNGRFVLNGKDEFNMQRINRVWVVDLSPLDQVKPVVLIGILFAAVGAACALWFAALAIYLCLVLFLLGIVWALLTFRRSELRASFKATDETGGQTVTLMHASRQDRVQQLHDIAAQIAARLPQASASR